MSEEFEKSETRFVESTELEGDRIITCHRNGKDRNRG